MIASGRVVLAAVSLTAIWFDPSTPASYAEETYLLLVLYLIYASLLAAVLWTRRRGLRIGVATHAVDLGLFSVFVYLTEGSSSPFFAYFTFAVVVATIRWGVRGTLYTAALALVALNGIAISQAVGGGSSSFELNRFIIRNAYLAVVAALLAYLSAHVHRLVREVSKLSTWLPPKPVGIDAFLGALVGRMATSSETPRALLVWEDPDEPWRHLIHWSAGDLHHERKPPGTYDPIVAEHLAGSAFLAQQAEAPTGTVLRTFPDGVRTWRGTAVNSDLASRFHAKEVLYLPLTTSMLDAHFLGFTKPGRTADDLVLGEVVARLAISSIEQFFHTRQLPQLAAAEERVRLARNLHDGVLQSLTAAALQVESVLRLLDTDPTGARDQLQKIERLITEEQRDLRFFVSEFRPTGGSPLDGHERLEPILQSMTERLAAIWNLRVSLHVAPSNNAVPRRLFEEIYHLVREALVNVARHAEATEARVLLGVREGRVQIVVHDNGRGFPFHGHYDHASLMALRRGPASLKDRLRVLGGTIAIDSHVTGTRLHLSIPLGPAE